ncbi:hypothetical protein Taro_020720 [Colocasia esculenta]|uniref:Exportin-1/Importin-beta-like domain-containing protein n=1 Tax=Colocasia esculenta TaxID=4460 RepID=A0A843UX27_COLES|nr:hypothetical protein [Colocasia esculenta]
MPRSEERKKIKERGLERKERSPSTHPTRGAQTRKKKSLISLTVHPDKIMREEAKGSPSLFIGDIMGALGHGLLSARSHFHATTCPPPPAVRSVLASLSPPPHFEPPPSSPPPRASDAAWEVATSLLLSPLPPLSPVPPPSPAELLSPSSSASAAATASSAFSLQLGFEVEFFAAQILRRKIQNEAYYLQLGAKDALLNALLLAAKRFSMGPPQLLTQICLALSGLVLRAVEHKKPIEQLFGSLHKLQSQDNENIAVLELLTVLPEEVVEDQNIDRSIDPNSRAQFTRELLSHTPKVLEFLLHQSEHSLDDAIQLYERNRKVLRCLLSWVRAGCFSEIPPSSLPTHPLLNFVFKSLQVPSLFDVAIEVLIELVSRYEGLPQVLLFRIQYLKDVLLLPAVKNRDEKVISGLACLMVEIGQAAPALIADASPEALVLADSLLRWHLNSIQIHGFDYAHLLSPSFLV